VVLESEPLLERQWYFVLVQYDAETGKAVLLHKHSNCTARHLASGGEHQQVAVVRDAIARGPCDLLFGALHCTEVGRVCACFNGKIARPTLVSRAWSETELGRIDAQGVIGLDSLAACWDLSAYPFGLTVADRSGNGLDAQVVNNPMRAVTGPEWDGSFSHFQLAPAHYDAIYLHDDDVDDADWSSDFEWQIPEQTPSGVYAARLRAGDDEDYIPFVVRPARASAAVLVVLPTFTYQAYANERFHANPAVDWTRASDRPKILTERDVFAARTPALGCSIYDAHTDGSYCCYSSLRRPVVNFRPKLVSYWNGAGRHFGADMYLLDWLDRMGFAHDVATDHDVHAQGLKLLSQYQVVVLASHPEYFSWNMRQAFEDHVANAGRLMYLGGNGAWWITDVDPARPHVIEVRKAFFETNIAGFGVGPGEEFMSSSGRRGGSWRAGGKPPESLFGVGFTGQGFCQARGYVRRAESFDPRVCFIFEGIGPDEVIGDFGLAFGGAAGDEFDRAYVRDGSPPNTWVLASSAGHPTNYCISISSVAYQPEEQQAQSLRSDLTYYEAPGGGAVFAAGSMCWCTSLPHNDYHNNVARVTANVLRRFLAAPVSHSVSRHDAS
jgi:N,N-dimethylformamidase